ncbi:MAG: class I SAM-dependent methyltransferase [Thermoguttaceae bacterium]
MDWEERAEGYRHEINTEENDSCGQEFRMITPRSRVLDVGCACGDMGSSLHYEKECHVWGCDYNPYSLQEAEKTGGFERLFPIDLNTFTVDDFPEFHAFFDFILLGDVLEHLIQPSETLAKLKSFLKPDGHFVVSIPNIAHSSIKMKLLQDDFTYTPSGLLDCTHLRFFTYKTFPEFFGNLGLKIEKVSGSVKGIEEDKIRQFPMACRRLIVKDIHSWIFQYVMKIGVSSEKKEDLVAFNWQKMNISKEDLPSDIYWHNDRSHYVKYVYGSFFSNILDFLSNILRRRGKKNP